MFDSTASIPYGGLVGLVSSSLSVLPAPSHRLLLPDHLNIYAGGLLIFYIANHPSPRLNTHILTEAQALSSFRPPPAPFPTFALDDFPHRPSLRTIGCNIPYYILSSCSLFLSSRNQVFTPRVILVPPLILSLWPEVGTIWGYYNRDRTSTSFKSSRSSFTPSIASHINPVLRL